MAGQDDAIPFERVTLGQLGGELDPACDVVSRAGPWAADVAARPVLHAPGGEPGITEGDAEVSGVDQVVLGLPASAVHDDDDRERAVAGGEAKVARLLRPRAPDDAGHG